MKKRKSLALPIVLVVLLILGITASLAFASVQGAIWTTDKQGRVVNGNVIYEHKTDVYLNGGPDKDRFQIPEGWYYIRVTEPTDKGAERVLGSSYTYDKAPQKTFYVTKDGYFKYDLNLDAAGVMEQDPNNPDAGIIQLYGVTGFKNTRNNGGVYKAWISKDPTFPAAESKTDNFKVKDEYWASLKITKFNDSNSDGIQNNSEQPIKWNVHIRSLDITPAIEFDQVLDGSGTQVVGTWQGLLPPGTYEVTEESLRPEWIPTTPEKVVVTIPNMGCGEVVFGNHQLAFLGVEKFSDVDGDGNFDAGQDFYIPWEGTLNGGAIEIPYGQWVEPGDYNVAEIVKEGWKPTTPTTVAVHLDPGQRVDVQFGNHQLAKLIVQKFNDYNGNGVMDSVESYIPWSGTVNTKPIAIPYDEWVEPGHYTVAEDAREGWRATTDTIIEVDLSPGEVQTVIFGNQQLAKLVVLKFNDLNGNGTQDAGEPEINWAGSVDGTEISIPYSAYIIPGSHTVVEEAREGWVATTPTSVEVNPLPDETATVVFGNRQLATLDIIKFYDRDGDKVQDSDEPLLTWKVHLTGTDLFGAAIDKDITFDGEWKSYVDPGQYTITEYLPLDQNWYPTLPVTQSVTVVGGDTGKVIFGNAYLGIGGHTHGFWGNPNGEYIFRNNLERFLSVLNGLPLVKEDGTPADFDSYEAFKVWNQDADSKNPAYMLSCQLASLVLNSLTGSDKGFINPNEAVYVGLDAVVKVDNQNVVVNGFVKVGQLITAGTEALQDSDPVYQNYIKTIIDKVNQDGAVVYVPTNPPIAQF